MYDAEGDWNTAAAVEAIPSSRPIVKQHIKKRALRNKALSIEFDNKRLTEFVGGFHKRKKKRRKEARRQLQEKERRKRIEARKQRKLEKDFALCGGVLPTEESLDADHGSEEEDADLEEDVADNNSPMSGTRTYEDGDMTVTVTTKEISREDEDLKVTRSFHNARNEIGTKPSLQAKKKPLKRVAAAGPHKKRKKRGYQKGNKKKNKR